MTGHEGEQAALRVSSDGVPPDIDCVSNCNLSGSAGWLAAMLRDGQIDQEWKGQAPHLASDT